MENQKIIDALELTAKLLELHGADEFKIKSFAAAAYNLDKIVTPLASQTVEQLATIQGVGKNMAQKINEIALGQFVELNQLLANTPVGLLSFFKIKGIGAKKIRAIWQELQITDINELLIACQNGEVAKLKGFGDKIQDTIIGGIQFVQTKSAKLRLNKALVLGQILVEQLNTIFEKTAFTGQLRLLSEEFSVIEILVASSSSSVLNESLPADFVQNAMKSSPFIWIGTFQDFEIPVSIKKVPLEKWDFHCFVNSASPFHLNKNNNGKSLKTIAFENNATFLEKDIYQKAGLPYIIPEMREGLTEWDWAAKYKNEEIIQNSDLKGVLHNHSTYSDGMHTLKQMAEYVKGQGYEYFGIADHSKAATYAKGLSEERVLDQLEEIDQLNKSMGSFKVLKGIEADILGDGSLDYSPDFLKNFDYVVASIHSNLKMTEEKAMERLIKAIENPATTILGHPTGRVLLERDGYPINHAKIIDACAANNVVLEINASPYRLDLDWRWIYFAMEKGVMLSINPDAHAMEGIHDMDFGIAIARKGGLLKEFTFNALTLLQIQQHLLKKHK